MSASSHTDVELTTALKDAVKNIWNSDCRDELTVNLVRKTAEKSLGLESGFFGAGEWHKKSRDLVKETAAQLDEEDEPQPEGGDELEEEPVKKSRATIKRKADSEDKAKTKRTKKETPRKATPKKQSKDEVGEDEEPESEDEEESAVDGATDDSDMSSVIDEPPARKRGGKTKASPKAKTKVSKKSSAASSAETQDIKKLQQQLSKCGVRKIWGVELKQHRNDDKAKLRHLKEMLRDIGMTGRFSEARAREIKEQRELAADLEAVQKQDKAWGAVEEGASGRAGRASRRAAPKSLKIEKQIIEGLTDSEEENDDDSDDSGGSDGDDDDASEGESEGGDSDEESEAEMSDESEDDMPKKKMALPKKKAALRQGKKKAVSSDEEDDDVDDDDSE